MEKVKENWQLVVFTMFITIIGNMTLSSYVSDKSNINNAASKHYVDSKDSLMFKTLINADQKIINKLEYKADKDDVDKVIRDVNYTRDKVDKIYMLLIEQK